MRKDETHNAKQLEINKGHSNKASGGRQFLQSEMGHVDFGAHSFVRSPNMRGKEGVEKEEINTKGR